jgi:hypothetical protein
MHVLQIFLAVDSLFLNVPFVSLHFLGQGPIIDFQRNCFACYEVVREENVSLLSFSGREAGNGICSSYFSNISLRL